MTVPGWAEVAAELARAGEGGAVTRFWLRDDDAVVVTPALERLGRLCAEGALPALLAVIPAGATPELAAWVAERPFVTPCQHGWAHANHAMPGERACELGGERSDAQVVADLRSGREAILALFGARASNILVPPWNRIRASLVPLLPGLGYSALSTFAQASREPRCMPEVDCDLDIVDWRNGKRGRSMDDLCGRLASLVAAGRGQDRPIGLLTHHLVHDEAAWSFLAAFIEHVGRHPAARFVAAPVPAAGHV